MVDSPPADVLRFVDLDVERKSAWGAGHHASRQLEVNGVLLGSELAARLGRSIEQSTPIVEQRTGAVAPQAYLVALLGGPKAEPLRAGRIAIGYCDACLDTSCGVMLAASLSIDETSVYWTEIGFEREDQGPAPKLAPFWKKSAEPEELPADHEWWVPEPFTPEISFRFERDQYLDAIQSERRRLGAVTP